MKASIRIAMLVTLTVGGTVAIAAQEPKPAVGQSTPAAADNNMTPYRNPGCGHSDDVQGPRHGHRKKEGPGA